MSSSEKSIRRDAPIGVRYAIAVLQSPVTIWKSLSHSMTGASTTLLLTIIVTLNIIWGFPWVGLFAACSSLMIVGFAVNRLMNPKLNTRAKAPRYVQAGETFPVELELFNRGRLPALDINVGFGLEYRVVNMYAPRSYVGTILPRHRVESLHDMRFDTRGVQPLPDFYVESLFPFSLFRATRRYDARTNVPVTPKLMNDADFADANPQLHHAVGKLIRSSAGDAMEYSGSREYQVGMPVRQWDFASWARLGRPIVREFSSPTQASVTLVVDTSFDLDVGQDGKSPSRRERKQNSAARSADLEHILSLAASVITRLCGGSLRVNLFVTSESVDGESSSDSGRSSLDPAPLLIRLASAEGSDSQIAEDRIADFLTRFSQSSIVVLTCRSPATMADRLPKGASVIGCRRSQRTNGPPEMKMQSRPAETVT